MATQEATTTRDPAKLLRLIEDFDMRSQAANELIEATCLAIKAILDKKNEVRPVDLMAVRTLCESMASTSLDLMNRINSDAEGVGANFKEVSHG